MRGLRETGRQAHAVSRILRRHRLCRDDARLFAVDDELLYASEGVDQPQIFHDQAAGPDGQERVEGLRGGPVVTADPRRAPSG